MTPFLTRSLTWLEVANATSIIFDLRITAVAGESEAETRGRYVAEAIRIVGAFLLNNVSAKRCVGHAKREAVSRIGAPSMRGAFLSAK